MDKNNLRKFQEVKFSDIGNKFDEFFYISKSAFDEIRKVCENDVSKMCDMAREGDNNAKLVLINLCKERLLKVFWVNFIGKSLSSKGIAQRIKNGDFEEFCSIVMVSFDKAIKAYNAKKVGNNVLGGFQYYFGQYVKGDVLAENRRRKNSIDDSAINPDGGFEDDNSGGWDRLSDSGSLDTYKMDEYNGFDESWEAFCNDPVIRNHKKFNVAAIFADMLNGMNVEELAAKYGVAKNTIRIGILQNIVVKKLKEYDIDPEDIIRANKKSYKYMYMLAGKRI